jgi:D-alanyl-D-alanine carboxypeptidase/D-alanyl-D-alanine-endopeptidase (penicillin-binding protein 4)
LPSSPSADPLRKLQQDITTDITTPGVQRAAWGIVVRSLDRREQLVEINPRTLLVPASVAKLVTLATAAEAVGWDYVFETLVISTGPVIEGVVKGDVVVVGSGDPSIGGRGGDDLSIWVDAFRARGIREIEGRIVGDDDAFEDPRPGLAWAWDDIGYMSGSLFGALNMSENRVEVTIAPGVSPGASTAMKIAPDGGDRLIVNRSVTGDGGSAQLLWPEQRPGDSQLTIAGSIPVETRPASLFVSAGNPTVWFASSLRRELVNAGVSVAGEAIDVDDLPSRPVVESGETLYVYRSHPLREIAQPLVKESINVYGEAVFRLNAQGGGLGTNDRAIEGMGKRLDAWGIPRESWQLVDGSGLSRRNVLAPDAVVDILERMYDSSGTTPWMTALPVAGLDGTLENRMKGTPAENNVRAKTGTMSNIRSLAGYVRTRDGEALAFAIIVNNFEGPPAIANESLDRIAVRLASFSRHVN